MTSDEYDKMHSDSIEQEIIDNEMLVNIPTHTLLNHLLGRCDDYNLDVTDRLLLGKRCSFTDVNGEVYTVLISKE